MKPAIALGLIMTAVAAVQAQGPRTELDVMHLADGTVLHGRILRLASRSIAIEVQLPGGIGSANREIPTANLKFIDFAPLAGEVKALANPGSVIQRKRLLELWQQKSVHLQWPTNNAGAIGLAYAGEMMKMKDRYMFERALNIYSLIEREDWDARRKTAAKKGRLGCLLKLKRVEEAIAEAEELARNSEDPELLLEARLVLAQADFERLKRFQDDHPRWMDDDDLTAERTQLYHGVLDQFLRVPLFFGSVEDKAASALWCAVQAHQFAGEREAASARARDLLELYPNAAEAAAAALVAAPQPDSNPAADEAVEHSAPP